MFGLGSTWLVQFLDRGPADSLIRQRVVVASIRPGGWGPRVTEPAGTKAE